MLHIDDRTCRCKGRRGSCGARWRKRPRGLRRATVRQDDDAAVSDGIEEMSEADETDSESDEYVPSLEESEDIFAPRARSTRPAGQKAKYQFDVSSRAGRFRALSLT